MLNDDWVSHPTWASEDGGFITHKKNAFEEALYRVEEERYEFALNIESLRNTIRSFEQVALQMGQLTEEEQRNATLPPNLVNGGSRSIWQRVIKKVYEQERGKEIIANVLTHPSATIPLVLRRLKQKVEEWSRHEVNDFLHFL